MKLNWGHKIMFAFIAFVALMFTLVYKSMHTDFDLVSKEYYKDELAFQDIIDGQNNALALSSSSKITIGDKELTITLPEEMKHTNTKGNIWFYCPTDAKNDRKMELAINEQAIQVISLENFKSAPYIVKLQWEVNGKKFYCEQPLKIHQD